MSLLTRQSTLALCCSLSLCCLCGCGSQDSTSGNSDQKQGSASKDSEENIDRQFVEDYPDVPNIPMMEEVAGIPIPRVETKGQTLELKGDIPADIGNPLAKEYTSGPIEGGRIVVRINSEPKSLNPITESSAVQSIMTDPYVLQGFATQNQETFEFEEMLAKRWIEEDSIKLSPTFEGKERRVAIEGETPGEEIQMTYPVIENEENPPIINLVTFGPDDKPTGETWVGLFPVGDLIGAPRNGYHFWSDESGKLEVSGIIPGTYQVKTGYEIIGEVEELEQGGLKVSVASPKNPLSEMLGEKPYLELSKEDYIDIQRGTVFTYEIHEDAKWSDGTPYTSKNLEFGYAVLNNPVVDCDSLRVYYSNVIRCDALDDLTVRLQYRDQYFQAFEFTMGLAAYSPPWHLFEQFFKDDGKTLTLEKLTAEEEKQRNQVSVHGAEFGKFFNTDPRYNRAPLGTGPYIIDRWIENDRVVLVRNKNYWNEQKRGYLDEIVFKFIIDNVTALQALKAGDIDFMYRLRAEQVYESLTPEPDWFQGKYVKASWYIPAFSYIGWNLNRPLFQDRKVRVALALLMDLQDFLEKKVYNEGVLVSGSQYYFSPGYDSAVKPLGYDVETARDLLEEAGWADTDGDGILDRDGEKFEFTFMISSGSKGAENLAAIMQENYKSVGINVKVETFEWASFLEKVLNKDFDAVTLSWLSTPESDPYQIWHSSGAGKESRGSNHVSFNNPLADELIEQVRVTLDQDKRTEIYRSFHRLLDSEQPYLFLYTPKEFGAYQQKYLGVKWYRLRPGFDLTEWYIPQALQ